MEAAEINATLEAFCKKFRFSGKGALCVVLVVTQHAQQKGLPLDADALLTEGGGQVLGLGKTQVQTVLARHGIERVLAAEGGRTTVGAALAICAPMSICSIPRPSWPTWKQLSISGLARCALFLPLKPFKIRLDASCSLRMMVRDVLVQAEERQKLRQACSTLVRCFNTVGAKLDCALSMNQSANQLLHHSFSTSDAQSGRSGDFLLGDVAIHVTTSPSAGVIERCKENLDQGLRPVIVTNKYAA